MNTVPDNLTHVLEDLCTDPDCEIHQIEVGLDEATVSSTDLAFFLAGAFRAMRLIDDAYTTSGKYNSEMLAHVRRQLKGIVPVEVPYDADRPPGTSGSWGEA